MISSLVFVAGPSGAGKSTLMSQLSSGSLVEEITHALPAGAALWPHTDCKQFLRRKSPTHSITGKPKALAGLVCHYDIMRPISFGYESFEADPGLGVLDVSRQVVIVSVLPPADRVAEQIEMRAAAMHAARSGDRLRTLRYRLTGRRDVVMKAPQKRLLELYNTPGWLAGWYESWLGYVDGRCKAPSCTSIRVEFGEEVDGMATFRASR